MRAALAKKILRMHRAFAAVSTVFRLLAIWIFCSFACGQEPASRWKEEVQRRIEVQDWAGAMRIADCELARAPLDIELRTWRARILTWSGSLPEAEREYDEILATTPDDPDNWAGLANVYSREGRTKDALRALDRAVELDPKRVDLRVAHARALRAANQPKEAKLEFQRALTLDPSSAEAHAGLLSLRGEPKHQLRLGVDSDLFNFASANHIEAASLTSRWSPHWQTSIAGSSYQRAGTEAGKILVSLTGMLPRWGALTVGGAKARDHGVIPKSEAFFDFDRGWRVGTSGWLRGLEVVYGQHWYWYATARILTISETTLFYLPHDWTWSLSLSGARSAFSGTGAEWRPAGLTRLGFPIFGRDAHRLGGNIFFAQGTENFAQVDQIGSFSAQTYGGGLRYQVTARQDWTGYAAYRKRTQDRTQTSFGFTYGIRF
jgi:tetratricopeptide (TPR) repeat protein